MGQLTTTSSQVLQYFTESHSPSKNRCHSIWHSSSNPRNINDLEMKKVVLRNFSDIATPTEAAQKLRNMKMTSD